MRRVLSILLTCIIIFTMASCSEKSIEYDKVFSNVFGFSNEKNSEVQSPPEKNIYIFNNEKEWSEFDSKYLNNFKVNNLDFNSKSRLPDDVKAKLIIDK